MCNRQGPTAVVAYNAKGFIFGAFTSQSYTSSGKYLTDNDAFLFRLKGKECSPLKIPVKIPTQAVCDNSGYGPYFGAGSTIFLSQNTPAVAINTNDATYTFLPEDLHGNDLVLLECEVYRVEGELKEQKYILRMLKTVPLCSYSFLMFSYRYWRFYGNSMEAC